MPALIVRRWRGLALAVCAAVLMLSPTSGPSAKARSIGPSPVEPNFELGARWTSAKVSKLVFDTSVTPHWMQSGDHFWYSYQTRDGRRFYLVDPVKKAKAPLFDHAKVAAALTSITRQPYDAQHLPFSTIKFRNDATFEFDVQVPRDAEIVSTKKKVTTSQQEQSDFRLKAEATGTGKAEATGVDDDDPQQQGQRGAGPGAPARTPPRTRTLRFEYDMASGRVTLNEDYTAPPPRPRWAAISPDEQTIVFARNHNLYVMDATNFAKAQKNASDTSIVETQLTTDGEEYYSYARSRQQDQQILEQ
jgi:dipeptidyl-peptidase-4